MNSYKFLVSKMQNKIRIFKLAFVIQHRSRYNFVINLGIFLQNSPIGYRSHSHSNEMIRNLITLNFCEISYKFQGHELYKPEHAFLRSSVSVLNLFEQSFMDITDNIKYNSKNKPTANIH